MFDILNLRNGLFKFVDNCKFSPVIISYEQLILVKKTTVLASYILCLVAIVTIII